MPRHCRLLRLLRPRFRSCSFNRRKAASAPAAAAVVVIASAAVAAVRAVSSRGRAMPSCGALSAPANHRCRRCRSPSVAEAPAVPAASAAPPAAAQAEPIAATSPADHERRRGPGCSRRHDRLAPATLARWSPRIEPANHWLGRDGGAGNATASAWWVRSRTASVVSDGMTLSAASQMPAPAAHMFISRIAAANRHSGRTI